MGTLGFAHPTRWNLKPCSGFEVTEHPASSVSKLLPGPRGAPRPKRRKPPCGKRSDIAGRRRRNARHARRKPPTRTRARFFSGFGIHGSAPIRILGRGRSRREPGAAAVFVRAHAQRPRLARSRLAREPKRRTDGHDGGAARSLLILYAAAHKLQLALAGAIDLPAERTHRPLPAAFSTVSSMRNPAKGPSAGSMARSRRSRRRATPSPIRLQGWKPPLSG